MSRPVASKTHQTSRDGASGNDGGSDLSSIGDGLYRMLCHELKDAGCFEPALWHQMGNMVFVVSAFGLGYLTLLGDPATGPPLAALVLIAFANVQAGFIAHEAGHGAVTRKRRVAAVIGYFFLTFGHSVSDVRFRTDFVRFTSRSRPSWWCRRRSVPDPACVKT